MGVALRKLSPNGTITNDKFCMSRHVRLHLGSRGRVALNTARRFLTQASAVRCTSTVIGSGIFLTPQLVAAIIQVPGVMLLVWVLTGLLTLAGALTNAEIASQITEAGGQYVFFRVLSPIQR